MSEIKGEDYTVKHDVEANTVIFQGELALGSSSEYQPIKDMLNELIESQPATATVNLRELTFLNSSGISLLSKFVLGLRKNKEVQLVILGSNGIPWQSKSLQNLEKLLPTIKLELEGDPS